MDTAPSRFIRHDLMCTDPAAGTRFYTELFGWKTTEVKVMGATIQRLSVGDRVLGAIVPFDKSHGYPSHWVPYVYVASIDDCCKRVRELGGQVCMGATDIPPGTFAMVNDPQKALFSPFTPRSGAPAEPPATPGMGEFCWDELLTNDVAGARQFYQSLFGWGAKDWDMGPEGTYTLFSIGETPHAGMMQIPEGAPQPPAWLPYVLVDDADANVARANEMGGQVALPPKDIPDVGRIAVLVDPTGAVFAILKPSRR
jgi:predicted enzyme related to lactoylglutathione lyase